MNIVIGLVLVLALLATVVTGATAFSLRSSDAAGNGLAIAYLVFFFGALWGLLLVVLLLAATRGAGRPPPGLSWTAITAGSLTLLLVYGISQFSAIMLLSDRRVAGPYELALQLTFLAGPLAFLLHAAWRTYGLPAPAWTATGLCAAVVLACAALPWPGVMRLGRAAPAMTPDRVAYPAALLWPGHGLDVIDGPQQLLTVPGPRLGVVHADPLLIDSLFRMYALTDLHPAGPSGPPAPAGAATVEFRLKRLTRETPTQTVRERFLECLPAGSEDARRLRIHERLMTQETLEGMIRAVRDE